MISRVDARPVCPTAQCTVKISGGLGNQMFQYAAGRAFALRHGAQLKLDTSFYGRKRHRRFELDAFPIEAEVAHTAKVGRFFSETRRLRDKLRSSKQVYREPHFHFDDNFRTLPLGVTLEGYFQSERYFAEHDEMIRIELAPPVPHDEGVQTIAREMTDCSATSLHVRRGDYVTNAKASQMYCACGMDYYRDAMERIPGNDPVYVFSDDIAWAKENLPPAKPLVFPNPGVSSTALSDLWLMTQATHHIIANSTFSWWGAYLAGPGRGLSIAPKRWFTDESIDDGDLIPDGWIRL